MKLSLIAFALITAVLCQQALAQNAAPMPEHSLTGNLTLVSDYRFRGISQTWRLPAFQGGFDYAHSSGLYLGNWNSNVSSNSYNNGASLEMDLYGGYKFEPFTGLTADLGVLHYHYPRARLNSAPGVPSGNQYNNTELYAGVSYGAFSAKLSYAVTDYFGLNSSTANYAYWSSLPARGGSKGTTYMDLNYTVDLGQLMSLAAHLGRTSVRNYGELSYTDYKLALSKELAGLNLGLALVGTQANSAYYQAGDSAWANAKPLGKPALLLSVGKTF